MQNLMRRLFCLLTINLLLFAGGLNAQTICIAEITTNNLNVRAAPNPDAEVVTQLDRGQQLIATILDDGWVMTYADNNVPVYFSMQFIDVVSEIVTVGPDILQLFSE